MIKKIKALSYNTIAKGETNDPQVPQMLAQTNQFEKIIHERTKGFEIRFRPCKRSQSIIIYSHCIVQDHSRTRRKDYYFRLMGL